MKNFQLKKTFIILVVFSLLVIPLIAVKAIDQPGDPFYNSQGQGVDTCGGSTTSCPPSNSGPLCGGGQTEYNGGCYPSQYCYQVGVSDGKGGTSYQTQCSYPPPPPPPSACNLDGTSVPSGSSNTFYGSASVPYGSTCVSQSRLCTNGSFSGSASYSHSSCFVAPPPPVAGLVITLKDMVIRYGESTELSWSNGNAEACTVTAGLVVVSTDLTGSISITNATGRTKYTLTCTLGGSSNSGTASTTLQILPQFNET